MGTVCQRCGFKERQDYSYKPCPRCGAPLLFDKISLYLARLGR